MILDLLVGIAGWYNRTRWNRL